MPPALRSLRVLKGCSVMEKGRKLKTVFVTILLTVCIMVLAPFTFAAESKYGGTLRIGVRQPQENNLDARHLQTVAAAAGAEMIYDRLFAWGEKGFESTIPALALSYQTKDNKVWTIKLRK